MPKKYHVPIKTASPRFHPVGKYATVEFREDCAGSCRECVKKKCVYGIFKEGYDHASNMDEPEFLYTCQSCFRCVQECTKGIFSRAINPEYRTLGDDYWRADIIHRTWYQAHTGKIPVSGAGYRGPFVGEGFDAMWTDMSEIVRPTRDGIHGREYINTCIEISRRRAVLAFTGDMNLEGEMPPIYELPIPVMFRQPDFGVLSDGVLTAMAKAAETIGTLMLVKPEFYTEELALYKKSLVPQLTRENLSTYAGLVEKSGVVQIEDAPGVEDDIAALRKDRPGRIVVVALPMSGAAAARTVELTKAGVDTLHIYADERGREIGVAEPRFMRDVIRDVHMALVEASLRQSVNLVFSGGIALAEHMAKAVICGADGIAVDLPLLVALECRLCGKCKKDQPCPVKVEEVGPVWGSQRIVNLIGAWRNQLIEVMGAMGIRETRRLRGEVGRSMWFEDLERENFGPVFGERKVAGLG